MILSVVIVNYNVKYFLEQCLCSVKQAIMSSEGGVVNKDKIEVIVVDNNSTDGSIEYLQAKYPFVQFISNKENAGFAKANNLASGKAQGKYILFLNPDTIIGEDCFSKCIQFMESNSDAGAMGVRMINGNGKFLRESKRGFPTPWVSFCKMIGLTTLFPRSRTFAGYYLGDLPSEYDHEVDILSGAFMLVRKVAFEKAGGFDEQFFMYAEDIDLSYSIRQAKYKNFYFSKVSIIHFKGESTRKDANYTRQFYMAMILFARKHFKGSSSWFYIKLLEFSIWIKATLSIIAGVFSRNPSINKKISSLKLVGDATSELQVQQLLTKLGNITIATGNGSFEALVFCQGQEWTFKQSIEQLQKLPPTLTKYFHGSGTSSLVASNSASRQGDIICA